MAVVQETVHLTGDTLARIQEELRAHALEGWLLYAFRGNNPIASSILGLPEMTRRYFVYIPAEGRPTAVTHRIEQQPWSTWIGENRPYSSWAELDEALAAVLGGKGRVAMEYAERDAVPYVDRLPAGVVELVRGVGVEPVSSGDLVSAFYARWTADGEASHHRAAKALHVTVHGAFRHIADAIRRGERVTELTMRDWVQADLRRQNVTVDADTIVAVNANAANPHYAPTPEKHAEITRGDLVLIDLWGKEEGADAIFADQTWMGYVGEEVPARVQEIFGVIRDARLAACKLVIDRAAAGEAVYGYEVDDASRDVVVAAGYGEAFIHRTGHSIDRALHGSGPNIDNLETRDTRRLIPGVGFSIEPGIYLSGDLGFRTEVDVFMGPDGPVVTTPAPQTEVYALLSPAFGGG